MTAQPFWNNLLFTTQLKMLKMKQIDTLFCYFTVLSSKMNNLKTIQKFSRTPEIIQGQQDVFEESRTKPVLIANSRTVLGAQGHLATLAGTR